MNILQNKVAIGDEVFIIESKYSDKDYNISIYSDNDKEYPLFSRDGIVINKADNIEELHSKVLAKFIKTYKKNRGNMDIINTILSKFLSFKEKDKTIGIKNKKNEIKTISSDEIIKSCKVFLDSDISAIIIAQDTNVIFIDGTRIKVDKDKILNILQYNYKILKNNRRSIENIVGDIYTMYLSLSECQIILSPIDDNRVCMIISKKNSSIGNLYKKAENIFKHSKDLFKNIGE